MFQPGRICSCIEARLAAPRPRGRRGCRRHQVPKCRCDPDRDAGTKPCQSHTGSRESRAGDRWL